ncbi:MAG: carboxypeptidase regulatory-like domain-containing protein, partial [Blastocatellia bacterium]
MKKTKVRSLLTRLACSVAALLLVSSICVAQSDTARIEGTVTDSSGAVVVGAKVVAENVATGIKTEAESNAEGLYVLTPLRIGTYKLEISANGFRKVSKPDITLEVNQIAKIDVALEAGSVDEVVQITGGAPLVETSTSSLGQVINGRDIVELPLNGRNFTQLATLTPGVTRGTLGGNADGSQGNAETFRQGDTGSAALSVNGLREQNNNFQLDGIDNNESIVNTIVFFPPVEALQEFKVITNVAPAEFGRAGGAVVNAVIKSGTNGFHGSAFEFIRNSALDARPAFSPTKPVFIRNQFGFTFGGPIVKDKTFFFMDFQGLRQRLPIEAGNLITVPTAQMRMGDFSQLLNPNFTGLGQPVTIYNPNTGQPFPNNVINIPTNQTAMNYLNSFPLPD